MAMAAIVTGGAGFIGSNLVDALLDRGDSVTVIDNLSTGRRENLDGALARGARLEQIDVCDGKVLTAAFLAAHADVVFHLAAQIDVRVSVAEPVFDLETNVRGTLNVLEAARASGVRRLVNTSTGGGLYGEATLLPTPESVPIAPLAPYGQGKLAAEGYCGLYTRLHGLQTVSLRYGNVYGPRQDIHGEGGVVAIFCGRLLAGETPVIVGDGTQTRDWVEVSDVVQANLLAAGSELGGSRSRGSGPGGSELGGAFNIGWGQETTVLGLIEHLAAVGAEFGLALRESEFVSGKAGEVMRSCLDASSAREQLGWRPQVRLDDGLRRIIKTLIEVR
jgi:UDP-glucose 4-epimerase